MRKVVVSECVCTCMKLCVCACERVSLSESVHVHSIQSMTYLAKPDPPLVGN